MHEPAQKRMRDIVEVLKYAAHHAPKGTGEQHVIPQIVMHIGAEKHVGKEGGHGRRRRKALRQIGRAHG